MLLQFHQYATVVFSIQIWGLFLHLLFLLMRMEDPPRIRSSRPSPVGSATTTDIVIPVHGIFRINFYLHHLLRISFSEGSPSWKSLSPGRYPFCSLKENDISGIILSGNNICDPIIVQVCKTGFEAHTAPCPTSSGECHSYNHYQLSGNKNRRRMKVFLSRFPRYYGRP